jgi:hypothetical protein
MATPAPNNYDLKYDPNTTRMLPGDVTQSLIAAKDKACHDYVKQYARAVYKGKAAVIAQYRWLIEADNDSTAMSKGYHYKVFHETGKVSGWAKVTPAGMVTYYTVEHMPPGTKPPKPTVPTTTYNGAAYSQIAPNFNGKKVWARLDRPKIKATGEGGRLSEDQLDVYERSMLKGIVPSGSTGADGVKFEQSCWVIKITISIASAYEMDNVLSPMASGGGIVMEPKDIYLDFNQLVRRH